MNLTDAHLSWLNVCGRNHDQQAWTPATQECPWCRTNSLKAEVERLRFENRDLRVCVNLLMRKLSGEDVALPWEEGAGTLGIERIPERLRRKEGDDD